MEDPHIEPNPGHDGSESARLGSVPHAPHLGNDDSAWRAAAHRGIPELSELVLACRHRLPLTLLTGVVVSAALAVAAWWVIGASYEAKSLVRVRERQDAVLAPPAPRGENLAFMQAQQQIVLSPPVLAAALHDEQLKTLASQIPAHNAVEWLQKSLHVDIQSGAEVMSIAARHPDACVSQALCNAATRAYLSEVARNLESDRQRRCAELERAARQADGQLGLLWAELNRVASAVGADSSQSLTIRDEIQLQAYREYAQQLRRAQLQGNELQSLLTEAQLRMSAEDESCEVSVDLQLRNHPDVVAVENRLAAVDARIAQMREVVAQDDSPKLARLTEQRAQLAAEVEQVMSALRPEMREVVRIQRRREMEGSVAQLQQQLERNQAEKDYLHARMAEIDTQVVRSDSRTGIQLEMARHAVERHTRLADALAKSLEEFKIESRCQARVALLNWAPLPSRADRTRQWKAAGSAAGLGWLIAIVGIGTLEWRSRRVRTGSDLRARSAHPLFGAQPAARDLTRRGRGPVSSGEREAAARLILCRNSGERPRIPHVMVSSASGGEPRHLVALELARALSAFHCRTLLIDCDATGGGLTRKLGADRLPGMLQLGATGVDARSYILSSTEANLDFLPVGTTGRAPGWIEPASLRAALHALRFDYDAIVVLGPAIMSSAESLLLASVCDQLLMAVFPGTSYWHELLASEQMASQAGIAVFGCVWHAGPRRAQLGLGTRRQGAPRPASEQEDPTEAALRADLAAMHREFGAAAASPAAENTIQSTDHTECTP